MTTRRQLILIIVASFSLLSVFHTFLISDGWEVRQRLSKDVEQVENEIRQMQMEAEHLRSQIDALRRRPKVRERIVRDELGYIKPDNIILELGASE